MSPARGQHKQGTCSFQPVLPQSSSTALSAAQPRFPFLFAEGFRLFLKWLEFVVNQNLRVALGKLPVSLLLRIAALGFFSKPYL